MKTRKSLRACLLLASVLLAWLMASPALAVQTASFESGTDTPPLQQLDYIDTLQSGLYVTWSYPVDPLDASNILYRIDALPELSTLNIAPEAYSIATGEAYPGPIYTTLEVAEWNSDARFFLLAAVSGNEVDQNYGLGCSASQCELIRTDSFGTEAVLDTAAITLDGNERYRLELSRSGAAHDQLAANLYQLPNTTPLLTLSATDASYAANTLRAAIRVSSTALTQATVDFDNFYAFNTSASAISSTPSTIVGTETNGLLGSSVTVVGDVNGDGFNDVLAAAPDAANTGSDANAGVVYLYNGSASGLVATPAWQYEGTAAGLRVGATISAAGDVNSDSYADVLVSTGASSPTSVPEVYLFLGGATGLSAMPDLTITNGVNLASEFGASLLSLGDINDDGFDDVLIGAPGETVTILGNDGPLGTAFVSTATFNGSAGVAAMDAACQLEAATEGLLGSSSYVAWLSTSTPVMHAIDRVIDQGYELVDSSVVVSSSSIELGFGDILTPINLRVDGSQYSSAVWTGTLANGQSDNFNDCFSWTSTSGAGRYGAASVSFDSWTEFGSGSCAVSAPVYCFGGGASIPDPSKDVSGTTGQVWLYFGSATGIDTANPEALLSSRTLLSALDAEPTPARFGQNLASGVVDNIGKLSLIIDASGGATRRVYAFAYNSDGSGLASTPHTELQLPGLGAVPNALLSGININNDGFDDILISDPLYDDTVDGGSNGQIGRTLIFNGASTLSTTPTTEILGVTPTVGQFGSAFSGGDINLDGFDDVLVSDTAYANGEAGEGAAYIFLGSANGLSLSPDSVLESDQASAALGQSVALGDIDNDGQLDVVAGANGYNSNLGAVFSYNSVLVDFDSDGLTDVAETTVHGSDPQNRDSDADGLEDGVEVNVHGTNPASNDTDSDGLLDNFEITHGFDPVLTNESALDGDSDGLTNLEEQANGTDPANSDTDGDGLTDADEVNTYATDPNSGDTDGDGLPDGFEVTHGYDPLVQGEQFLDLDTDGLPNGEEFEQGTNANDADSDDDGLLDGFEVQYGFNPLLDGQENLDGDGDGLDNLEEQSAGTDPNDPDTDGDSFTDGGEVAFGTDPLDANSNPAEVQLNPPNGPLGSAIAIDGDTLIIGSPGDDAGGTDAGAVFAFERVSGVWQPPQKLLADIPVAGSQLGFSVAVSGDYFVAGSPQENGEGAAYVFIRSAGVWNQQDRIVSTDLESGDEFGTGVSIYTDGVTDTVFVGAPGEDVPTNAGAIYHFARAGVDWIEQQKIEAPSPAIGDEFGSLLSGGGTYLSVASRPGRAVFVYNNTSGWAFQQEILETGGSIDFGSAISINDSGALVIGDSGNSEVATSAGAAFVYNYNPGDGEWQLVDTLRPDNLPSGANFGAGVAISSNGNVAAVGAPEFNQTYVFRRFASGWAQDQELAPINIPSFTSFGQGVALDTDTVVVGTSEAFSGSVYVFDLDLDDDNLSNQFEDLYGFNKELSGETLEDADGDGLDNLSEQSNQTNPLQVDTDGDSFSDGVEVNLGSDPLDANSNPLQLTVYADPANAGADNHYGFDVAVEGDLAVVGAPTQAGFGSAFVLERVGGVWQQQVQLLPGPFMDIGAGRFGSSVAISGDTIAVGAPESEDTVINGGNLSFNSGAVYVFVQSGSTWTQQAVLEPVSAVSQGLFGSKVAIDGDSIIVGSSTVQDVAIVFTRNTGVWSSRDQIFPVTPMTGDHFASAVDIEGDTVVIGAEDTTALPASMGSAYVFTRNGGSGSGNGSLWSEQQVLTPLNPATVSNFGLDVSISGDSIVVAASNLATVFVQAGNQWVEQQKLDSPGGSVTPFANEIEQDRVAIDEDVVVFSGLVNNPNGEVRIYTRENGIWSLNDTLTVTDSDSPDGFGSSLDIDAGTVIVGDYFQDGPVIANQGAAYLFTLDKDVDGIHDFIDNCPEVSNADQANNDVSYEQTNSLAILGDACDLDDDAPLSGDFGLLDLVSSFDATANAGVLYSSTPVVGYLGPHPLCFEGTNIPAWATLDSATGAIIGTPVQDDYGDNIGITLTATEAIVTPAQGTLCAPLAVLNGQSFTSAPFSIFVNELTPPSMVVTPESGIYNTSLNVALTCVEPSGSGCANIFYTTDGSMPDDGENPNSMALNTTNGSLPVTTSATTLLFVAYDNAGNDSEIVSRSYTIDAIPPTINLTNPVTGSLLNVSPVIMGSASDSGDAAFDRVDVTVLGDDGRGLIADGSDIALGNNATVTVCTGDCSTFSLNDGGTINFANDAVYTITATAYDTAGNRTQTVCNLEFYNGVPRDTTLNAMPSSSIINIGGTINLDVTLAVPALPGEDLTGEAINVTINPPVGSGSSSIVANGLTDANGDATFNALGSGANTFDSEGEWIVDVSYTGSLQYEAETAQAIISIDTTPPDTLSIDAPGGTISANTVQFAGQVDDSQTSISTVEVAITDTPVGGSAVNPPTINATIKTAGSCDGDAGDGSTPTNVAAPCWEASYTPLASSDGVIDVTVTATNSAGLSSDTSGQWNYYIGTPQFTTLDLNLSSNSVINGGELDAALKLTVPGNTGSDLAGEEVTLTITPPVGSMTPPTVLNGTVNSDGQLTLSQLGDGNDITFNEKGTWSLEASYLGSIRYAASTSNTEALLVGTSAGYAVLIQGKAPSSEGLASHNKTLSRVYDTLKRRNFEDQNILYFNYNFLVDHDNDPQTPDIPNPGVDFDVDFGKAFMQTQIENLSFAMNNNPAPLYVIMVDHGNTGGTGSEFLIDNLMSGSVPGDDVITPADLDSWLDTIESNLSAAAAQEPRVIINGSCYSGGFIDALTGATGVAATTASTTSYPSQDPLARRVVITSSAGNEVSYKGPLEADGVRVGEYFIEELFDQLDRGENLRDAFVVATDKTEIFTRSADGASINGLYLDTAVQHPLICDNDDGVGSNNILDAIVDNGVDGNLAKTLFLGTSAQSSTNSLAEPARIIRVTPTDIRPAGTVNPEDSTVRLILEANDNAEVGVAYVEIRSPATTLQGGDLSGSGVTEQLEADALTRLFLLEPGNDNGTPGDPSDDCAANEFCLDVDTFTTPGKYEIYYYVEDQQTGALSPSARSLVYKENGGNVSSPDAFDLLSPGSVTPGSMINESAAIFQWESNTGVLNNQRVDADGDLITYTLTLCEDVALTTNCRIFEEIRTPFKSVMGLVSARGVPAVPVTYYWRVTAIDAFGADTDSTSIFSFKPQDVNNLVGVIEGLVLSASNATRLQNHAVLRTDNATTNPLYLQASTDNVTGEYSLLTLSNTGVPVEASVPGFQITATSVTIPESCSELQILLLQCTPSPVQYNFLMVPAAVDSDGDGLNDDVETNTGTYVDASDTGSDPNNPDTDGDGLNDGDEVNLHGTNPNQTDSDGDGIDDNFEIEFGTDPNDDTSLPVNVPALPLWSYALLMLLLASGARYVRIRAL